jgi:hypothetical protein
VIERKLRRAAEAGRAFVPVRDLFHVGHLTRLNTVLCCTKLGRWLARGDALRRTA